MKQRLTRQLICETGSARFNTEVENWETKGWIACPESLCVTISSISGAMFYACLMEKQIEIDADDLTSWNKG